MALVEFGKDKPMDVVLIGRVTLDFNPNEMNRTLDKVKTSNMGTLYELEYRIVPKNGGVPKEFLDEIRCRNGNLNIVCGRVTSGREEL